jgi:lysine 2,3-aminomutase
MVESPNWTREFSQAFKNLKDLYDFLNWELTPELISVANTYSLFIPRALAQKIKDEGPEGVLAREFLPHQDELNQKFTNAGLIDPIGDKTYLKAPQLIHRYSSRALFTPTTICPVHCRYCFRKNELNATEDIFQQDFAKTIEYLKDHPEISEIIFTGGDPLTLSNEKIKSYLLAFSEIRSIKDIRFHTRYPVILPERLDDDFLSLMNWASEKFRTLSIAVHANHIREFDENNSARIKKMSRLNLQLLSQTVLLRGVNDTSHDLLDLMEKFIELKIRPYYLHHPDQVKGGMHFYTSIQNGRELYQTLRTKLPGWAIPHYVIDIPGGRGKVSAFNPESTKFSGQLITLDGEQIPLKEPGLII